MGNCSACLPGPPGRQVSERDVEEHVPEMVLDPAQVSLELGNDPRNMTAMFAVKNSGPTAFRYTIRLKNDEGGQKSALASQIEVTPSMQGVLQAGAEKELTVKYLPPFRPGLKFRLEVFASTMHEGDDDDPLEQGAQRAVRVLQQQFLRCEVSSIVSSRRRSSSDDSETKMVLREEPIHNYQWMDNSESIVILVKAKGAGKLPRDCAQVAIDGRSLSLAVIDPTDGVPVRRKLQFECLYDAIEDKTKVTIDAEKMTLVLRKRTPRPWPVLTASKSTRQGEDVGDVKLEIDADETKGEGAVGLAPATAEEQKMATLRDAIVNFRCIDYNMHANVLQQLYETVGEGSLESKVDQLAQAGRQSIFEDLADMRPQVFSKVVLEREELQDNSVSEVDAISWLTYNELIEQPEYLMEEITVLATEAKRCCTVETGTSTSGHAFTGVACLVAKQRPDLFAEIFPMDRQGAAAGGFSVVRLHQKRFGNVSVAVVVDHHFPVHASSGDEMFTQLTNQFELWLPLLEKACAKMRGSYEALRSATPEQIVTELTGFYAKTFRLPRAFEPKGKRASSNTGGEADVRSELTLRNILLSALADGSVIVGVAREQVPVGLESIILPGRCYGILRWRDVIDKEEEVTGRDDAKRDAGTKLHLCIFSPWKNNVSMKGINEQLEAAGVVPDTIERQAFWVDVSNFLSIFERAIISREVAKDKMTQQQGRWHDVCAGGSLKHSTWRHNPQFSLSSSSLTRVVVSLTQLGDGGTERDSRNHSEYQPIALYAIRGAHPSDIASLLLPGGSYGGSGKERGKERNRMIVKTRERSGSMPSLVFGGSVENDVNLTTLEEFGDWNVGEDEDHDAVLPSIHDLHTPHFPVTVRQRTVSRDLILDPSIGPITLIPVTENPGTEGQFLLTVQELSGASGSVVGDEDDEEDEDDEYHEEEQNNQDSQSAHRVLRHNQRSSPQIYLMAMPEGGGWRGKTASGSFLGRGPHAGSTVLHACMAIPSLRAGVDTQNQESVGTVTTEWGSACTFAIGRSTTSIVAILVAEDALQQEGGHQFAAHAKFRLRIVRKWPSSKLDEVVADSGLCNIVPGSHSSADREVICTATLLPNKDVSASSPTPENEVRYQIVPFIQVGEEWSESYSFPFEIRMYSDKQVLQRSPMYEGTTGSKRRGENVHMSDVNESFAAASDDGNDSLVLFRTENFQTQSHFAPIPGFAGTAVSDSKEESGSTKIGLDPKVEVGMARGEALSSELVERAEEATAEEDMEVLEVRGSPPPPLKLRGRWQGGVGGCFPNSKLWRQNPQYQIEVPHRVRLMVVLERLSRHPSHQISAPKAIGIVICTADQMPRTQRGFPRRVIALEKRNIVTQSPFVASNKVVCEVELEGADRIYTIMPSLLEQSSELPLDENDVISSEPGEVLGPVVTAHAQEDVEFELTLVTSSTIRVKRKPLLCGCAGDWRSTSIRGAWTSGNSGGCFNHSSWMLNPNYVLRCPRGHYVVVVLEAEGLAQSVSESLLDESKGSSGYTSKSLIKTKDSADSKGDGDGVGDEEKGTQVAAAVGRGFYVMDTSIGSGGLADSNLSLLATGGSAYATSHLESQGSRQQLPKPSLLAAKSRFSCNREVSATLPVADCDVDYAIIPCTLEPGFWGGFTLTAYSVEIFESSAGIGPGAGASGAVVAWHDD